MKCHLGQDKLILCFAFNMKSKKCHEEGFYFLDFQNKTTNEEEFLLFSAKNVNKGTNEEQKMQREMTQNIRSIYIGLI